MHSVLYCSTAVGDVTTADLAALLEKSRSNNDARGITGLLLFRSGRFLQLLEGEREAVETTMSVIADDPRHVGVTTLLTYEVESRQFPSWTMGFDAVSDSTAAQLPGYRRSLGDVFTASTAEYGAFLPALRELIRWYQARPLAIEG